MGLLDLFRGKETTIEDQEDKRDAIESDDFIEAAGKTADIITSTIKDGKFDAVTQKLKKIAKDNKKKERFVFEVPKITCWVVCLIIGLTFSVGFMYFLTIAVGTILFSTTYRMIGLYGLVMIVGIIIVNILMIIKAAREIRFSRRYNHYFNILRYRNIEIIDDLANMIDVDREVVEKDLNKAIKNKVIPQGHFGRENIIFMVSDEVFEKYSEKRAVYDRYFKKLIEERNRVKERTKETEELLEQGQEYIEKIRDSNEIIKDKEISKKLDRMEKVVATIFHEVDVNPAQANKLGVFMNYYLPTTEKLLEAYMELDEKDIKGKGTEKTQNDISRALDSINSAFEGLLERFYQEQERDITSEIYAMEVIMKQEGLQNDEDE